jgi:hypothetical protein
MSGSTALTLLSEDQRFNGDNLLEWKTNITQLLGTKGLMGYVNGTIPKPQSSTPQATPSETPQATPTATPIYSKTPTLDEWEFRDQLAKGHITLNCKDIIGLGVMADGTAKEAWDSIQREWGKSTDMRRSHAQEALNRTMYVEGTDVQEHVKLLRTLKGAVDNLSTEAMLDETWRGVLIRSIPPTAKWLPVLPSLYAMSSSADIVSTLRAHGMILGRDSSSNSPSNTVLAARTSEACKNPNCKAKKRSTHTTDNCYWPGGGKEGQFPTNFGQKSKANAAATNNTTPTTSTPDQTQTDTIALSARIPNTPGQSGILLDDDPTPHPHMALISSGFQKFEKGKVPTFMDSGASDTMFVSREAFTNYTPIASRVGDSAKAEDGNFDIVGEGSVRQRYRIDGKEREVTYTRALHTPTLNANLISVSALDKAGLTTTFGQGRGVARKPDGTVVLTGKGVNGMYLLDVLDNAPNTSRAMLSLSQPTTLVQWHRRFTHCSPLTHML